MTNTNKSILLGEGSSSSSSSSTTLLTRSQDVFHYHQSQCYGGGCDSSSSLMGGGIQRSLYVSHWGSTNFHYNSSSSTTTMNKEAALGKWRSKQQQQQQQQQQQRQQAQAQRHPLMDQSNQAQASFTSPTRPSTPGHIHNHNSAIHNPNPNAPSLPTLSSPSRPLFPCTSPKRPQHPLSASAMSSSSTVMPRIRKNNSSPIPILTYENCLYVSAHGVRNGSVIVTEQHLKFLYYGEPVMERIPSFSTEFTEESYEEMMNKSLIRATREEARRHLSLLLDDPQVIPYPLDQLTHVYPRTYMMRDVALEFFTSNHNTSFFLAIPDLYSQPPSTRRQRFVTAIQPHAPHLNLKYWNFFHSRNNFLWNKPVHPVLNLTEQWIKGNISNYEYLLNLNSMAGRTFHDPGNYPIMPWVLSNYVSTSIPDLSDPSNFRDLSKPMGALCPVRLQKFLTKYHNLGNHPDDPPFMYGSHYSNTGGVVLHYLVRLKPFADLHKQLQGDTFDVPDRLFRSVPQTWDMCSRTSPTEVKELTPEWYSDPSFLRNHNNYSFGKTVDGVNIHHVELPPWADDSADKFIQVMRRALESDVCSAMLPAWIDLIFGYKQKGVEAEKAHNVFYHLTYYEPEDLAKIENSDLREEIELHLADFGHCPLQLFVDPHPQRHADSVVDHNKGELRMMVGS